MPDERPVLSERVRQRIDRLLDQAEAALDRHDWVAARDAALAVLGMDPANADAQAFLAAAERALAGTAASPLPLTREETDVPSGATQALPSVPSPVDGEGAGEGKALPQATSFCNGRYVVNRFLGEGGKKRVYLAHDTLLDRDVAFALIKTEGLDDAGRRRIQREAQAMGRLGAHPHIVSVFDLGDEAGQPYIVTELMDGGDVEGLIEQVAEHRLPIERTLQIGQAVCQGLAFAHDKGIVHRDLKPGNVWLTGDGRAKIGDFGLAVAVDRSRLTQAGMMVGTVSYMPPEQAMGGGVTPRSDLYSLGAMLYEMVCGRPPFVGDESVAIIGQHLNTPPVAPSWHRPDLPPALEAVILRLLEKDPSKRPASAAEVGELLAGANFSPPPSPRRGEEEPAGWMDAGGLGPSPIYRRTFVGREAELKQLEAAFDAALAGQGALRMVVGEPGIGKTSLCEQLATYAALRGGRALVGHCYEEGSLSLPYLPFVEAMRSYVLAREPEGLRQDLGSGAAEVARLVSEIRDRVAVEPLAPGDAEEERYRLLQAVVGFLRNASTVQPLLLILEDLHDADGGTLDLLLHLARQLQGARLLVVGTYRDIEVDRSHPLSGSLAELRRVGGFDRVLLRGLTADEVQRMMSSIAGQEVSWQLAEAVHRQTEGNPLFIQEVLRYLVEEGLITRDTSQGRWRRSGAVPLELQIPEGLRDVIGKRLSRLSPECNRLLASAAVIGREFRLDTLQAVAGPGEESVIAALEEATRVGVLEEWARVGLIRYRFAHAFFRQTLYEEMSAPRRLQVHHRVAQVLEAQYAARLDEHAAELAEHFAQATDPADLNKAVRYGELAAGRAMAVHAYGEAARLLEGALEVQEVLDPGDRARRCDLLLALGEALGPAGEPQRVAEAVAPEALALAEAVGDQPRASRVCDMALEALGRYGAATIVHAPIHHQWVRLADRYAAPGTRARVVADIALMNQRIAEGQVAEARGLVERAMALARQLDDQDALSHAVSWLLEPLWGPQHQEEQLRLADEFSAPAPEGRGARHLAEIQRMRHAIYLRAGQPGRAAEVRRDLDGLASKTRDPNATLMLMVVDTMRATVSGDLEAAIGLGMDIAARGEELGMPVRGQQFAATSAFQAQLYLGKYDDALAGRSAARTQAGVNREGSAWGVGKREVCLAHLGRGEEARAGLHFQIQRLDISTAEGETPAAVLTCLLEVAVLVGDREAAALLAGRLEGVVATHMGDLYNVARLLGGAAVLLGDRAPARAHYERGLQWATTIGFRPEIALTRLELAEVLLTHYPEEQAEALAHLDFAIEEFRAMKMQPYLERALRHKGLLHA